MRCKFVQKINQANRIDASFRPFTNKIKNPTLEQFVGQTQIYLSFCDFDNVIIEPDVKSGNFEYNIEIKPNAIMALPSNIEIISYEAKIET